MGDSQHSDAGDRQDRVVVFQYPGKNTVWLTHVVKYITDHSTVPSGGGNYIYTRYKTIDEW